MKKSLLTLLFAICICNFCISQNVTTKDNEQIESLINKLDDADGKTRASAAITLVSLGEQGRVILLKQAASGPTLTGRVEAITALRSVYSGLINPELDKYMEELRPLFEKEFNPDPVSGPGSPLGNPSITQNNFMQDWSFHKESLATGKAEYDKASRSTGSGSIRLIKSNSEGEIYLRSVKSVKVRKGETCLVRIYFRSDNTPTTSALQILFEDRQGNVTMGDDEFAPDGQTFLHNTPPLGWAKRMALIRPVNTDGEYFIRIALRGNPSEVSIDDISAPAINTFFEVPQMETLLDPSIPEPDKKWFEQPAPIAEIKRTGDRSRMYLDGKPVIPAVYFSIPAQYGEFSGMEKLANIRMQTVFVGLTIDNMTDSASKQDFSGAIKSLEYAALSAPNSHYFINLNISWSLNWLNKHPDDVYRNQKGQKGYGTTGHFESFSDTLPAGKVWWISPFSFQALKEAQNTIGELINALKSSPYSNRIIGCHISGGHDGQFFTGGAADYSPAAQTAFREWLKSQYLTEAALQKAWNDQKVSFDNASIPDFGELDAGNSSNQDIFFNPATDRRFMDQRQFQSERGLIIRDQLAKAFKEAMGRPVIGMTWAMWGGRGQGTETIFMNSKNLDILIPQPIYPRRIPGYLGGLRNAALGSYKEHNKMIIKELDLRTWLRNSNDETYAIWVGALTNPSMFESGFRKEVAQMIGIGQGFWMYDIHRTLFRDPVILNTISKGIKAYEELELQSDNHYKPEVAVVWVDASLYWEKERLHTNNGTLIDSHSGFQMMETGFTFDDLYLSDILKNPDLQNYKMYIFKDAWRLSDTQRKQIAEKLQNSRRTLVWNYAPGYIGDDKLSVDYISSVTGMKINSSVIENWPKVRYSVSSNPYIKGLSGIVGMGEISAMALAGGPLPGKKEAPPGFHRFIVEDKGSEVLATYEDGKVAVAVKRLRGWTSVYFGMLGSMDAAILSRAAVEAGVKLLVTPGQGVEFNGQLLSVYGLKNEKVTVTLPNESRVLDFDKKKEITTGNRFSFDAKAGTCYWFRIKAVGEGK